MEVINYSAISANLNSNKMIDHATADLLKCGHCCTEFLLSDILVFIQHKTKPCKAIELNECELNNCLRCSSCDETFHSAQSLLRHAQFFHKINLFVDSHEKSGIAQKSTGNDTINSKNSSTTTTTTTTTNEIFIDVIQSESNTEKNSKSYNITVSSNNESMKSNCDLEQSVDGQSSCCDLMEFSTTSTNTTTTTISSDSNNNNVEKSPSFSQSNDNQNDLIDQNENTSSSTDSNSTSKYEEQLQLDHQQEQQLHQQQHSGLTNNNDSNSFYLLNQETSNGLHTQISSGSSINERNCDEDLKKSTRSSCSSGDEKRKEKKIKQTGSFYCDICKVAFNQKIHLTKHSAKHTGIKPFKCSECNYSTVERSHLKVHVRVHTGEKPFKCSYCEYATAQSSTLKIHKKRHHDKLDDSLPGHKIKADLSYLQIDQSTSPSLNKIESDLKQLNQTLLNNNLIYNGEASPTINSRRSVSVESTNSQKRASPSSKRGRFQHSQQAGKQKFNHDYETSQNAQQISLASIECPNDLMSNLNLKSSNDQLLINRDDLSDLIIISGGDLIANNLRLEQTSNHKLIRKLSPDRCVILNQQLTDAENKLLGLANIALEREGN